MATGKMNVKVHLTAEGIQQLVEVATENGKLRQQVEQLQYSVKRLEGWVLNQKREADKWRTAYAEACLIRDQSFGVR